MKSLKMALLLFLVPFFFGMTISSVSSLSSQGCADYELIFARGSGQSLNDKDFQVVKESVSKKNPTLKIDYYELGQPGGYEAINIDFNTALGAYVSAGKSYRFSRSVENGIDELLARIKSESKKCNNKKYILVGYSQGALVMDGALNNINPEKVLYVANFGDPKLYLPEGNRACKNIGISNYRVYAPDCNIKEGILGAIKPYQPDGYYDKLGIWCNKTDFICGSSVNLLKLFDAHTSYNSKDGYDKLAEIIADKTTQKSDITPTTARYSEAEKREIFLIFDHAQFASKKPGEEMKSIEDNLKEKLIEVSEHGTRVGIYNAYSLLSPILVLGEAMPFTNDNVGQKIDEVNIKNNQTDGWVFTDYFNNIYVAIYEAAGSSFWTPGSERNIYVLTNVKHNTYKSVGGFTPQDATLEAKKYGAKISFLSENGNEKNATYEKMARDTGGQLIGNNYSKILLKQMQVEKKSRLSTKTFNINQDTEYTLIIINDLLYGFSKNKTITITDLDEDYDNEIRFVSYDSDGNIKSKKIYNLHPKTIKTPDTSSAI